MQLSQRALSASDMDGELFVDRETELSTIDKALDLRFSVYLTGTPGSGKTSLLHRVEANCDRAVFVNAVRVDDFSDLIATIAHDIWAAALSTGPSGGQSGGRVRDQLSPIRSAAHGHPGSQPVVVLLDELDAGLRHDLFGRFRDETQQIPVQWVVAGRSALRSPEDTFFEATVTLEPFTGPLIAALLKRRALTASREDRVTIELLAAALADSLSPSTPRAVLSTARSVLLSPDIDVALRELAAARNALTQMSSTANKVFGALVDIGPTHAGDDRLLSQVGTSRNRIVQVLRELEQAGLVVSAPDGRRKIYGPDLSWAGAVFEDAETGAVTKIESKHTGPRQ